MLVLFFCVCVVSDGVVLLLCVVVWRVVVCVVVFFLSGACVVDGVFVRLRCLCCCVLCLARCCFRVCDGVLFVFLFSIMSWLFVFLCGV